MKTEAYCDGLKPPQMCQSMKLRDRSGKGAIGSLALEVPRESLDAQEARELLVEISIFTV